MSKYAKQLGSEHLANMVIAKINIVISVCYFIVGLLTMANIYKANIVVTIFLFLFGILFISSSLYCMKTTKEKGICKYIQVLLLLTSVFVLNVAIGYKIWMLYPVPIFLSVRYYQKRFTIAVGAIAMLFAIASAFTNAYLAPYLGIIDLNQVSYSSPGTIEYYSWLHNAVIKGGYETGRVIKNGLELSALPNCIAIFLSVLVGNSLITNADRMLSQVRESLKNEMESMHQALTDQLTGLNNRRAYEKDIEELDSTETSQDLIYISADVNGLKTANDSLGHAAGDEIIIGAARCLESAFKDYGKVYRIGGDEYAVILKAGKNTFEGLISKLSDEISSWSGKLVEKLSLSYGYASIGEATSSDVIHSIAILADLRMYQAKEEYYFQSGQKSKR